MEAWFISDIHLKTTHERNGEILLRFLSSLQQKDPSTIQLYLLGDIFDYWIGGHRFFTKKFALIVEALKKLKKSGVRIVYVEGNHDLHIHQFWKHQLGVEVYVNPQYNIINGFKIRYEHGDMINHKDKAYRRYRRFVRHPLMKKAAQFFPGYVWSVIGKYASRTSRKFSAPMRKEQESELTQMIRDHAARAYYENEFDIIISGHMHVYDDFTFKLGEKTIRSINLGSWLGTTIKILHINGTNIQWVKLL